MPKMVVPKEIPAFDQAVTPDLLAKFIAARRTESGLRLMDTAPLCGVSARTLSQIEKDPSHVTFGLIFKVLEGLGVELRVKRWESCAT